ncbi:hypothetical protein WME75_16700 [Sorangium sp. So ce1014]|uniref:hypothetical protein n=1 Tax=Sorangium sp. So ce1014 TaxID=3133326 RepID=UPI003F5FF495
MRGRAEALFEPALHVFASPDAGVQQVDAFFAAHLLEVRAKSLRAVVVLRTVKQKQLHPEQRVARNTHGRTPFRAFLPMRKDLAGFVRGGPRAKRR